MSFCQPRQEPIWCATDVPLDSLILDSLNLVGEMGEIIFGGCWIDDDAEQQWRFRNPMCFWEAGNTVLPSWERRTLQAFSWDNSSPQHG